MWKDEFIKNYCDYEGNYLNVFAPTNKVIEFIESLLKEQREICAKQYELYSCLKDSERYIKDKIINAPEPTGK